MKPHGMEAGIRGPEPTALQVLAPAPPSTQGQRVVNKVSDPHTATDFMRTHEHMTETKQMKLPLDGAPWDSGARPAEKVTSIFPCLFS